METMSNQQASGNQRDLHQNKQILGSFPLPFTAGTAGGNEWLKDLIGHWDSWGNSSLQTRAALSLSGRRQNWGSVGLVHQLKQVATTHVAEWHSKKVVTGGKKKPFSSLASSGHVVLEQKPGKGARGHPRQVNSLPVTPYDNYKPCCATYRRSKTTLHP